MVRPQYAYRRIGDGLQFGLGFLLPALQFPYPGNVLPDAECFQVVGPPDASVTLGNGLVFAFRLSVLPKVAHGVSQANGGPRRAGMIGS
jgi:hypothetical protein